MESSGVVLVYVSCPSRDVAVRLGRVLVERRLAACANVLDGVHSIYWWDGAVQEEPESLLLLKTAEARVDALVAAVRELHPYDVPAASALPVVRGNPDYLRWVHEESGRPEPGGVPGERSG